MNEEILKKLYESAGSVFDMPAYDQFVLDMQDDTKLNSFRQNMSQHYDMPELDQLKSDLGIVKKKRRYGITINGWFIGISPDI